MSECLVRSNADPIKIHPETAGDRAEAVENL